MNNYELILILRQELGISDVENINEEIDELIKSLKGKPVKKEYWGIRNLAYQINKSQRGHYLMLNFSGSGDICTEITRKLNINDNVMRFMLIRIEKISDKPSMMMENNEQEAA